jgi:hypothetical protein
VSHDRFPVLVRRFAPGVVLAVAGLILLAAAGGRTGLEVAALVVGGAGGVWLVAAMFFTVGQSEDLDRVTSSEGRRSRRPEDETP